jgi:hypothetical protein
MKPIRHTTIAVPLVLFMLGLVVVIGWRLGQSRRAILSRSVSPPSASPTVASSIAPEKFQDPVQHSATVGSNALEPVPVISGAGDLSASVVRVRAAQVLATVNGVPITLKDLIPLPGDKVGTQQQMSVERFGFVLNGAIERELNFQRARALGVKLTEAQEAQLAELRAQRDKHDPRVFDTLQQNPANTDFEVRDARALMLQATLAERAGIPSPDVTPGQVEEYYRQHQADYQELPTEGTERQTKWAKIDQDIRNKLAPQIHTQYHKKFEEFLSHLKANAQISTSPLGS